MVEAAIGSQGFLNLVPPDTKVEPSEIEVRHNATETGTTVKVASSKPIPHIPLPFKEVMADALR
jgi:hypothetical protein